MGSAVGSNIGCQQPGSPFRAKQWPVQLLGAAGVAGLRIALKFAVAPSNVRKRRKHKRNPLGQFGHIAGTWNGSTLQLLH